MMREMGKRLLSGALMSVFCLGLTVYGGTRPRVLTVGFVSGSYWNAPIGN